VHRSGASRLGVAPPSANYIPHLGTAVSPCVSEYLQPARHASICVVMQHLHFPKYPATTATPLKTCRQGAGSCNVVTDRHTHAQVQAPTMLSSDGGRSSSSCQNLQDHQNRVRPSHEIPPLSPSGHLSPRISAARMVAASGGGDARSKLICTDGIQTVSTTKTRHGTARFVLGRISVSNRTSKLRCQGGARRL